MKIAIIGSGISGLTAAYYLSKKHEITLFESDSRLGGHTATVSVDDEGKELAIDTGFIVFNDWTYPEFIKLLDQLKVASKPSAMSFSVSDEKSGLEYSGSNLNTLFAQRRNLFSPSFLMMIKDILSFNKKATQHLIKNPDVNDMSLKQYLKAYGYSEHFANQYLIPMGAAIWSSSQDDILNFSVKFFIEFFNNHGLLNIQNRPQWRVIEGGSSAYIDPLIESFKYDIRLNTRVAAVRRKTNEKGEQTVIVESEKIAEDFDQVVFACHSDQALKILKDSSVIESSILKAIPYSTNEVVLHTDEAVLPKNKRCWSSWNVALGKDKEQLPRLTYNMNILQSIESKRTFCVTLNQSEMIDSKKIIGSYNYAHPQFSQEAMHAQKNWGDINGKNNTWFCGAYWRNGFHEDGVWSAKRVVDAIETRHNSSEQVIR